MFFELTEIKRAQGEASGSSRIKSNSKRRWRARKNVFTWLTWIPTNARSRRRGSSWSRSRAGSSSLSRAYCAPVVRSSIKIPTEISHSLGIPIPTSDRRCTTC